MRTLRFTRLSNFGAATHDISARGVPWPTVSVCGAAPGNVLLGIVTKPGTQKRVNGRFFVYGIATSRKPPRGGTYH